MAKRKHNLGATSKQIKSSSKHVKEPESENDFLETADDFEKTGGKWRVGDQAKAARNFNRAIEVYDKALQKFPKSFDLAYNKARLLLELAQNPHMSDYLSQESTVPLLQQALIAHRFAMNIDGENADVMFNTGQVLTALSEALEDDDEDKQHDGERTKLLEEAVELLTKCLGKQEHDYQQTQSYMRESDEQTQNEATSSSHATAPESADVLMLDQPGDSSDNTAAEWVTIVEPITPSDILDTALAILAALSSLVSLHHHNIPNLQVCADIAARLITTTIPQNLTLIPTTTAEPEVVEPPSLSLTASGATFTSSSRAPSNPRSTATHEAHLAIAQYTTSLSSVQYTNGLLEPSVYLATLETSFEAVFASEVSDPGTSLKTFADALIDCALTIYHRDDHLSSNSIAVRRKALCFAREALIRAGSDSAGVTLLDKSMVYSDLGDVSMMRGYILASQRDIDITFDKAEPGTAEFRRGAVLAGASGASSLAEEGKGQYKCAVEYYDAASNVVGKYKAQVPAYKEDEDVVLERKMKVLVALLVHFSGHEDRMEKHGEAPQSVQEELRAVDMGELEEALESMVGDGLVGLAAAERIKELKYSMSVDAA